MPSLTWKLELHLGLASASGPHGKYFIRHHGKERWQVQFLLADHLQASPRKRGPDLGEVFRDFENLGDALRSCHEHSQRYGTDASDRLTPVPGR